MTFKIKNFPFDYHFIDSYDLFNSCAMKYLRDTVFLFLDFAARQSKPLVWSNQDHAIQVRLSEGMVVCHAVHEYRKEQ